MNYRITYNGHNLFYLLEVLARHMEIDEWQMLTMVSMDGYSLIISYESDYECWEAQINLWDDVILEHGGTFRVEQGHRKLQSLS